MDPKGFPLIHNSHSHVPIFSQIDALHALNTV